jgi:predicted Zn-dependent protease with MMP-like domain
MQRARLDPPSVLLPELLHLRSEQGPCPGCFVTGEPVVSADLAADAEHWLVFAAAADRSELMLPDNGIVIDVEPGRFEDMVLEALDGLPEELGRLITNVAVTVEHGWGPPGLLGLYQGIPLTERTSHYGGVLPDRITIYRRAIIAICRTEQEVADQVRRTIIHEVGHHFGIDDDRLHKLGW